MNLEWRERVCPLCGSTGELKVFAESNLDPAVLDRFAFSSRKLAEYMHPRLVECGGCGMLYASPALAPDTLESMYREADFDAGSEAHYASRSYSSHGQRLVLSETG